MKLVIDISENDYLLACNHPETLIGVYAQAIKNGTPLPKGHGRLIDASQLPLDIEYDDVENAPTIIEADTGEE